MRVFEDLNKGATSLSIADGYTASRVFFVTEIEGERDAMPYRALTSGRVPIPGDAHPTIPNIFVQDLLAPIMGSAQVEVTANYKAYANGSTQPDEEAQTQITISSTVQTVETNKHIPKKGGKKKTEEPIRLEYKYPAGKDPDGVEDKIHKVIATISKQQALTVVTFSRLESKDPLDKSEKFTDKLNSTAFLNGQAGEWLCNGITSNSSDGGSTYDVSYSFTKSPGGWVTDVAFTDSRTGEIPSDVDDKQRNPLALRTVGTQESADFNSLNLGPLSKP